MQIIMHRQTVAVRSARWAIILLVDYVCYGNAILAAILCERTELGLLAHFEGSTWVKTSMKWPF